MRIIDNQHDYYDYMQDPTDTIVFDRRGSHLLTKEKICHHLSWVTSGDNKYFILMQCGATYWLLLLTGTKSDLNRLSPSDYEVELLHTWKNYTKDRCIVKLDVISFYHFYQSDHYFSTKNIDIVKKNIDAIQKMIDTNDYRVDRTIENCYIHEYNQKTNKHITRFSPPLLKATGFVNVIDPTQIFLAIEEHFSLLKTESERTEAIGSTNNDKIVMHGFDTKTSFRG